MGPGVGIRVGGGLGKKHYRSLLAEELITQVYKVTPLSRSCESLAMCYFLLL